MGLRVTTFLLIANIVVFFWIIRVQESNEAGQESDDYFLLLGSRSLDVDKLEILKRNVGVDRYEPSIVLQKERDRWFIETPVKWPANFHAVNSIINQIKYLQKDVSFAVADIIERGQQLGDYGLDSPGMVIKVYLNEKEMVLKVGAPTELENKFYLLGPNEKNIYVLSSSIIDSLDVEASQIRDPEIFSVQNYEIDVLQIEQKSETAQSKVRLEREDNNWSIQLPILANADNSQVESVVQQLLMTRVDHFIEQSDDVSPADFVAQYEILIEGNQSRQKLSLGGISSEVDSGSIIGKLEGWDLLFKLDSKVLDLITNAQERLRDRSLVTLDSSFVHSIDIVQHEMERKLSLRKLENGEWQVMFTDKDSEIASLRAEKDLVIQLIEELNELRTEQFVTDAPTNEDLTEFGLETPSISVSLNDGQALTLQFGKLLTDENEILVKLGNKPSVYGVEDLVLETLNTNYLHYRDREIDSLSTGASIIDIEIKDMLRDEVSLYHSLDQTKVSSEKVNTPLSADQKTALEVLLNELRAFRVESIISDKFEEVFTGEYGNRSPWRFELTIRVLLPGGVEEDIIDKKVYYFTRRLGGSLQGGASKEKNLTFELRQGTIDSLYKLVFERRLPEDYRNPTTVPPLEDNQ